MCLFELIARGGKQNARAVIYLRPIVKKNRESAQRLNGKSIDFGSKSYNGASRGNARKQTMNAKSAQLPTRRGMLYKVRSFKTRTTSGNANHDLTLKFAVKSLKPSRTPSNRIQLRSPYLV
jgi:hypothetical protein